MANLENAQVYQINLMLWKCKINCIDLLICRDCGSNL